MKKLLSLFIFLLHYITISAQEFIVTDVQLFNIPEKDLSKAKEEMLGCNIVLTFYDNDVEFLVKLKDGKRTRDTYLSKVNDNKYVARTTHKGRENLAELELNRIFKYIKSAQLTNYEDGKISSRIVIRRK